MNKLEELTAAFDAAYAAADAVNAAEIENQQKENANG